MADPRGYPVRADARRDHLDDDRRGTRAAALGGAARAVPAELHPCLRAAAEARARLVGGASAAGTRRGGDSPLLRGRCGIADVRAVSPPRLLHDGDGLPRRARPPSPAGGAAHRVLSVDVGRGRGRRVVQRDRGAARVRLDRGISVADRGGVRGAAVVASLRGGRAAADAAIGSLCEFIDRNFDERQRHPFRVRRIAHHSRRVTIRWPCAAPARPSRSTPSRLFPVERADRWRCFGPLRAAAPVESFPIEWRNA